ncbi:MAG: UDPGP type 1 family protein [Lachnospiraceae bacterium]|nr:UDPGP type 1 family protein [Lachnospiraceae bacterium]
MTNYERVKKELTKLGQEHLLRFYDQLSADQQWLFIDQLLNLDYSCLQALDNTKAPETKASISPLTALRLSESEARREEFTAAGIKALKDGRVAAVLLAGGMGTRLGSSDPKGMYDIGITRPVFIFQRLFENLRSVTDRIGRPIHFLIMTSEKNDEKTRTFIKDHNYFGYDPSYVNFFVQNTAPCCDFNGKILLESPSWVATSPNGNGGWFDTMLHKGIVEGLENSGVRWLNVFSVDNVLQRIADPAFIGAVILSGCASGSKVVRKADRDEKIGVMCLEDGRPSVIEYTEMSDALLDAKDEDGEPSYNYGVILNYLFRMDDLKKASMEELPLHIARKKIPCIDEKGNPIVPAEPNGFKFELFILDLIKKLPGCLPFEVEREQEFAPIKNKTGVDSVESARILCEKNGITL